EFEDLLFMVKKIVRAVKIPVTVDIESGYSVHLNEMARHVEQLYEVGVAGINIEDSSSKNGKVEMDSTDEFCRKLYFLKNYLERKHMKIFINARTDAYLLQLQNSFQITSERITAYEKAGVDGLFVPYLKKKDEISAIVQSTKLPVNLLASEDLPPFHLISQLGVKRISMGPYAFRYVQNQFERITKRVIEQHSFAPLYEIENQTSIAS
ncbi:MAG TPA: isocitrate lyase/phosphoenolpyruvate mutase family protein, partial [Puia sp.]|nr:isocitrate lyase/phosphoenolpyruvate mutase family protein [Puia sp.]